ncbi:MAG: prolyl oligopeptidase family serine peptidase [Galbibacter orientalis]|uniref:prolyl oligopeptidase family serine peptidase n=1 Tax=Galbibacter orientalis TaxID=453852 RepID=UPI003001D293
MRNKAFLTFLFILITGLGYSQDQKVINIWDEIPESIKAKDYTEEVKYTEDNVPNRVSKVSKPTLTVFLPEKKYNEKRPAILICPGGGYSHLSINKEGYKIAKWLNSIGIAAFVLKYRLPSNQIMKDKKIGPLQDAQRAIRVIRKNAENWNINTEKVGVIGFSAGGHLAATLSTQYNKKVYNFDENISARPDFSILLYPVIFMEDTYTHKGSQTYLLGENPSESLKKEFTSSYQINSQTPPAFLVHAIDDQAVPVENSIEYFKSLKKENVAVELHLYEKGGHGFGMGNNELTKQWTEACEKWLLANNILPNKKVYLFSYFKGNGEDGLHYAYSMDGYTWKALNNDASFLTPVVGESKLMRDPCIIRGRDGNFHMVWTCGWTEKGIGYASSPDLIHWSKQQYFPVMETEEKARNCWAPEITYDAKQDLYLIYWATTIEGKYPETQSKEESGYNHRMYYTTTKNFKEFSATELLYEPGFNVIDATVVPKNGQYVMFLKDETREPAAKNIRIAFADTVTGPYGNAGKPITGNYWAEGPTTAQIDGDWIVYFDKYIDKKYGAVKSPDLKKWTDISDEVTFPKGMRHGSVIEISIEEFNKNFSADD